MSVKVDIHTGMAGPSYEISNHILYELKSLIDLAAPGCEISNQFLKELNGFKNLFRNYLTIKIFY